MGSYQLPALHVNPPEQTDLLGQVGKLLQLKQMQQGLQQGQLQNQQMQTQMDENTAFKQALANAGGDPRKALPEIMKVAPQHGIALQKQLMEWDKASTEQKLKMLEVHEKQVQGLGQLASKVTDPQSFQSALGEAVQSGLLDPQTAQSMASQGYDPNTVEQWKQQAVGVQEGIKNKQAELTYQLDQEKAKETARHNVQMEKHAGTDSTRFVADWLAARNMPDTPANRQKAFKAFTDETKIAPAAVRAEIYLKRPVEVADEGNPGQTVMVPQNQSYGMAGKSSSTVTAPRKLQEYMTSGKGGQQITAYNTAIAHLDTLRDMGMALNNGNIRQFNKVAQKWATETGNPAPASFDAARAALSGEVASTLKASGATDQEIEQVQHTLDKAQGPKQVQGVINTYQSLLRSKRTALMRQYSSGLAGKPAFEGASEGQAETRTYQGATYVKQPDGTWKRQ